MFSNQSVAGQPSPAGMAIAATPESASVFDAVRKLFQSVGACTPASEKSFVLYQTTDLLAALKNTPYSWLLIVPSFCHESEKFAFTAVAASPVSGKIWFFCASCCTSPGWAMSATSGGSPPATRLLTSTDVLSPPDVYVMVAPVLAVKPSRTALNDACSAPLHSAMTSRCCPLRLWPLAFDPPPLVLLLLLQAATVAASIATNATPTFLLWRINRSPSPGNELSSSRCVPTVAMARSGVSPDRAAVVRVEEVHPTEIDGDLDGVALMDPRPRAQAGHE